MRTLRIGTRERAMLVLQKTPNNFRVVQTSLLRYYWPRQFQFTSGSKMYLNIYLSPKFKSCSECVPRGVPLWTGPALCKGNCTWNAGKCEVKPTQEHPWPCTIGPGCHPENSQHPEDPQHSKHPKLPQHPANPWHPQHPEDPELEDGTWSAWGRWGSCSQSCGRGGSRTRTRKCSPPSTGGKPCHGSAVKREACFLEFCLGEAC